MQPPHHELETRRDGWDGAQQSIVKAPGHPRVQILVNRSDAGRNSNLFALDAHGLYAVLKKPSKRALRLEANQKNGGTTVPQPSFKMMSDAACLAHSARRYDDVKAGKLCDRLALVDRLGETQMLRVQ